MKGWHARREQGAPNEVHGVSRRTVTRGAAWAAPVLVTSVAAPAMAASGALVAGVWTEARYSGANGKWGFTFRLTDTGTTQVKVTKVDVFSTYTSPATNPRINAPVHTWTTNTTINAGAQVLVGVPTTNGRDAFDYVPQSPTDNNLLPGYYNNLSGADEPKPLCVDAPGALFGSPAYPDAARRLLQDNTYVVITYTYNLGSGTQTGTLRLDFTQQIPVTVPAGCTKP